MTISERFEDFKKESVDAYEQFEPEIKKLLDRNYPELHPDFLGQGHNSAVSSIVVDEQEYAIRVPLYKPSADSVDDHLKGAFLAADLPRMERIVAASPDDGITVSEVMSGKTLDMLTAEELNTITDDDIWQYVKTADEAHKLGVGVDYGKSSNFLFDPKEGFGFVDLGSRPRLLAYEKLANVALDPFDMGFIRSSVGENIPKSIADPELGKARLDLISRVAVANAIMLDTDSGPGQFLGDIEKKIDDFRAQIDVYERDGIYLVDNRG